MSDGAAHWRRLQDIVHAALERPAETRAAFLDEACDGDDQLRREAASLLEQDDRAGAFLATPLGVLAAGAVTYSPGGTATIDDSRNLVGSRLGEYEITSRLGAGGMGEVYRARDHALHRQVAIKVLPAAFATDRERLTRFEREARLLASLNHPNIGAVYGLAGDGSVRGIVLELIEGETLEARLAKGAMPRAAALALAQQIARALDHAHQHGVMHRDLKPANIMLTKSGAKLLDFGLAKWAAPRSGYSPSPGSASARPDGVDSVTSEGTILGTLHYMAPEQLEGQKVDPRADVFAFGAVLYEMLTGTRAFDGGSAAAVMASVLNTDPPALATIKRLGSPGLERIVRKCLAKDPDNRWQTVRDLADELQWVSEEVQRPEPQVVDRAASGAGVNRWATVSVATLALALTGWAGWRAGTASERPSAPGIVTFMTLPFASGGVGAFDISVDGTKLVYVNNGRLYLKRFDQPADVPVPGSEGADEAALSPNGEWVAFYSKERLLKVNVTTMAAPVLVWDGQGRAVPRGTGWLDDSTIVTSRQQGNGLMRVPADGGQPQAITTFTETPPEDDHHHPQLLPGGRALIFTVHDAKGGSKVAAQAFSPEEGRAVGERTVLIESGFDAQYASTGHLVFAKEGTLLAVPFDAAHLKITGPEVTLVEDVATRAIDLNGAYRVSKSGTLVFLSRPSQDGRRLVWVDRKGAETQIPVEARDFGSPSVSPDGKWMAYAVNDGRRRDLYTYEFSTGRISAITSDGRSGLPIFTPDSQALTYASTRDGISALFVQSFGGTPEHQVSSDSRLVPGSWSPNGQVLTYWAGASTRSVVADHMFSIDVKGDRKPKPLLHGPNGQRHPSISPDGRWIAYTAETPRTEVFVSNYPELTLRRQVSIDGGREPKWSRDGGEIVYRSFRGMFAVPIDTTRGFSPGTPHELFKGDYVVGARELGLDYDLAHDGRFVMIKPSADELRPGFRVVLNWVAELARRVPTNQ